MKNYRLTPLFLLLVLLPGSLLAGRAAPAAGSPLPPGFSPLFTAPGITVYEELDSDVNAEVFVQVVNLAAGARVELLHGPIVFSGQGEGVYGGANPRFDRQYLPAVWEAFTAESGEAVCLVNGTFFKDMENGFRVNPTTLSFPLKRAGVVVSEGHDRYRFYRHRRMFLLWSDRAEIVPLDPRTLYDSPAPDILVGLSPRAAVRAWESLGRTFVGVADGDGDGSRERVLIYSGEAATQAEAEATLRAFGATEMMMLDGGGSSQLFCEGRDVIQRSRPLPQTLITVPGPAQPPHKEWPHIFCTGPAQATVARIACR